MKRPLVLAILAVVLVDGRASAAGINLGWGVACPSTAASSSDATDPCDNTGFHDLVGSAVPSDSLTSVTGEEIYVDFQSADDPLPDLWRLESGGCRDGSLYVRASFPGFPTTVCKNYWNADASGGFQWGPGTGGASTARLQMVFARTLGSATLMAAGTEYYLFHATIDGIHAVADTTQGVTLCAGCLDPACLVFSSAILTQPVGMGDALITAADVRQQVTWQGGLGVACSGGQNAGTRPVWGQVKSLLQR